MDQKRDMTESFDYPRIRISITREMSVKAIATLMSEGNRNTYNLLILSGEIDTNILLTLDDMGMRGAQVWAAFAGFANKYFPKFKSCVMNRDPNLIDYVNKAVPQLKASAIRPRFQP